jgi:hypothetical protein
MPQAKRAFAAQTVSEFTGVFSFASYTAVEDDAWIATTDVAGSTSAIESGRYKDVNLAGAAGIAAFCNAFPDWTLPFAFGGDGASIIVPAGYEDRARTVLAGLQSVAESALGLTLRTALIPVRAARAAGHDVRLLYHELSGGRRLAMLSGGGVAYAEALMKTAAGAGYSVSSLPTAPAPNLDGLSCRWQPILPQRGVMATILVQGPSEPDAYLHVFDRIAEAASGPQSPLTSPPAPVWPPKGLNKETKLLGAKQPLRTKLGILGQSALGVISTITGLTIGGFDGRAYRASLVRHCDALKFVDGLKMVVDCTPDEAGAVEAALEALPRGMGFSFGVQRSSSALMTCFVQSTSDSGHVHFIDGSEGGYAIAARAMKRRTATD